MVYQQLHLQQPKTANPQLPPWDTIHVYGVFLIILLVFVTIFTQWSIESMPHHAPTMALQTPTTTSINHVAGNGGDNGDDGNNNRNNRHNNHDEEVLQLLLV